MKNRRVTNKIKLTLSLLFCGLIMLSCSKIEEELVYADASTVWWLAPTIIAEENKIFEKNNLNIRTFDVRTGLASKNAVVAGHADVGMVAATPLALGAYDKDNVVVLCSFVESDSLIAIVTKDSDIPDPVAVVKGTISEFYYYKYMKNHFENYDFTNVNFLHLSPPRITNSIIKNDANSAVIWEPFATNFQHDGLELKTIREGEIYKVKLFIITRPKVLKKKRIQIEKFIKSISDACQYIATNSSITREHLENKFNQKIPNDIWNSVDFAVKADVADYEVMKSDIYEDVRLAEITGIKEYLLEPAELEYLFNHDFIIK